MTGDARFGRLGSIAAVFVGVASWVVLVAVAAGVQAKINELVARPELSQFSPPILDTDRIANVLSALVATVIIIMMVNIVLTSVVLGETSMRARRKDISTRRFHGATRRRLLLEFVGAAALFAAIGGVLGEGVGIAACWALNTYTPLPTRLIAFSWGVGLPLAIALSVAANLRAAIVAANLAPSTAARD